ncbi:MAG: hypothetical protein WCF25_13585 [Acidimicrobiales bacterium]
MSYGLTPRPELPPDELAALIAAAEEILRSEKTVALVDHAPVWRFSGRWFNAGPYSDRRPRLS